MAGMNRTRVVEAGRTLGWIVGNFLTASVGAKISGDMLDPILRPIFKHELSAGGAVKEDLLCGAIAFGLGYIVYYRWKTASAKWIWIAGAVWFAQRVLSIWFAQRTLRFVAGSAPPIFLELSGVSYVPNAQNIDTWVCTLIFVRTMFYSIGAACCSRLLQKRSEASSMTSRGSNRMRKSAETGRLGSRLRRPVSECTGAASDRMKQGCFRNTISREIPALLLLPRFAYHAACCGAGYITPTDTRSAY